MSSDYVFDGTAEVHGEDEPFSPLSVYGQTKAAGRHRRGRVPAHYIVRSSWVIGEGRNFVRTMKGLSDRVADPQDSLERVTVVDDQCGRLTFTRDMAEGIFWLLGTAWARRAELARAARRLQLTGSGPVESWAAIAAPCSTWPTATARPWNPSRPPSTTPPPRARSPRGRTTPRSTSRRSRVRDLFSAIGRKSC